ncbi:kinase-like protein [Gigaspora margarita]|uniref:Kinase-like protein n=1 Tax=Gigaspora margarita TaxID=4874 RepID=A0A8H4ES86_GIGMA|nr:kinase-like protein [Gigaspora margarita]
MATKLITSEFGFEERMDESTNINEITKNSGIFHHYETFEDFEIIGNGSKGIIQKAMSITFQKIVVLKEISQSQNYSLRELINDVQKYQKIDSHDNILKLFGLTTIKDKSDKYMLIVEYADNGTLRNYLKNNFDTLNWDDKLRLAKQLTSAVMHLHSNNIIHGNIHSENIFICRNDIKLSAFRTPEHAIKSNSLASLLSSIQYSDPEYLQNIKTYKLTKRSDIYSLGVLFWELSSGIIPFEFETLSDFNLLNSIIQGKRETVINGTPREFAKIYTDCWQFKSKNRPTINQIYQSLQNIKLSDTIQIANTSTISSIKNSQNEKKIKLKIDNKGIQELIQTYQEQYDSKIKELEILGTFLKTLKQSDNVLNPFSNSIIINQSKLIFDKIQNTIGELTASSISEKLSENSANIPSLSSNNLEKNSNNFNESPSDKLSSFKFILDLFQYFFKYFDTYEQHNVIGPMLINYFQNNNKNPTTILNHLINHKHHLYFTGIIGFCFQYGIGTIINHKKAIEMYTRATELKDTFGSVQTNSKGVL